jgi:HJR/Mrr/RecB family endonuclease
MWQFNGSVGVVCNSCGCSDAIPVSDLDIECIGGDERGMGIESIYRLSMEFHCRCDNEINIELEASEYPVEFLNFVINNSTGAVVSDDIYIEHMREIYSARDLRELYVSIEELLIALQCDNSLLEDLTSSEFEEVVAEVFRKNGFSVELTKRTRDGGKDIIAIQSDSLGIANKYFIECKKPEPGNKVSVDVVRQLQGVKYTKDGPNKVILATTSRFTRDARKFVEEEADSKWDITLADYDSIIQWVNQCPRSQQDNARGA